MRAREKIAYIRGLLEAGKPEDKLALSLYSAIAAALDALADEVDELNGKLEEQRNMSEELFSFCEELDSGLADVEQQLDGCDYLEDDEEDDEETDEHYQEMICPSCGLHFLYHRFMSKLTNSVKCPDCDCMCPIPTALETNADDVDG
ncbi:MAG: hypothetical protein SOZ52_05830 [Pyramidobacter sp.]|nr:hypothetical protein [Pyramidobacter sp.]